MQVDNAHTANYGVTTQSPNSGLVNHVWKQANGTGRIVAGSLLVPAVGSYPVGVAMTMSLLLLAFLECV